MKILLVTIHVRRSIYSVPLGVASFSAALTSFLEESDSVKLFDFYPEEGSSRDLANLILNEKADAVGFSIALWNRNQVLEVIHLLKQSTPELIFFAGGADVSANSFQLKDTLLFDILVKGEGEPHASELLFKLKAAQSNRPETTLIMENRLVDSLKSLPSPWLDGILDPSLYDGVLWELARGCPFHCSFCYESKGSSTVRHIPEDRIRAELELFIAQGVQNIFILDPTFNFDLTRSKKLLRLFHSIAPEIHFSFEARSEFIDEELAELFGLMNGSLQIGLQSSVPSVLEKINRRVNLDLFNEKILLLHQYGVIYGFDLIFGLPGDDITGFLNSIDFALSMRPNHLDVFPLSILPGTALAEEAEGYQLEYQHSAPYAMLSSPRFSVGDMDLAKRIAASIDFFYNKGAAVSWFSLVFDSLQIEPSSFFRLAADLSLKQSIPLFSSLSLDLISYQRELISSLTEQCSPFKGESLTVLLKLAADIIQWYGFVTLFDQNELDGNSIVSFYYHPGDWLPVVESGLENLQDVVPFLTEKNIQGKFIELLNDIYE